MSVPAQTSHTSAPVKRGILLLNLGSPASSSKPDIRRYLTEFLMDPYVLDSPWVVRKLLVSGIIVPLRSARTSAAYASIWRQQEPGSPLLWQSRELLTRLRDRVDYPVELAMRYGMPSIQQGLKMLLQQGATEILLMPLYPQHASSTRTTSVAAVRQALHQLQRQTVLRVLPPFYHQPGYIEALAAQCSEAVGSRADLLLFSFHGLPERQITAADATGEHCLKNANCCETPSPAHAVCYRHQAYVTARLVARKLGLAPQGYRVAFQSRLGRLPWLTPYTADLLEELPSQGYRRIAVACPSFVADNLETLEEIGLRGRSAFLSAGGEELILLPCLNCHPLWLETLAGWCKSPPPQAPFDTFKG